MRTVGVVGAGITGLCLAEFLDGTDVDVTVFESADEPGGVVRSRRVEGRVLELGPQRTRLTPSVRSLAESVGIEDEFVESDDLPLYVYRDGGLRRAPLSVREAVTTDLISWRGKARMLLEPLTRSRDGDETVARFLTRKFGREAYEAFLGPVYGGIYASDPDEMYVRHSLGSMLDERGVSGSLLVAALRAAVRGRDTPPPCSFEDGLGTLPEALYDANADSVELGKRVDAVRPRRGGFEVEAGSSYEFDSVVLTTPAGVTAELVEPVDTELSRRLSELSYNPLAYVHVESDADLRGMGYQTAFGESLETLGVTWNASLFDRDGVYTCFLGGMRRRETLEKTDDELARVAVEEFEEVTGYSARRLNVHRLSPGMPAYDTSWEALDGLRTPDGLHLCANYESRAGIPGRIREARRLADELAE